MRDLPTDKVISCFYDSSDDCVKVISPDGLLMAFNPNGLKAMEIDNERDVLGKDWLAFWRGDIQPKARRALVDAKKGKLSKFEGYCPTFKGKMKYWKVTIAPLFDDYGDINWLLVMSQDLTKQRDLEQDVIDLRNENKLLKYQLAVTPQQAQLA